MTEKNRKKAVKKLREKIIPFPGSGHQIEFQEAARTVFNKALVSKLEKNKQQIVDYIRRRISDVNLYFYIKKSFDEDRNHVLTSEFKGAYIKFYVMNSAGLRPEHYNEYFNMLSSGEEDLTEILKRMHKIPTLKNLKTIQFSFATKLIHTVDNHQPIFDKHIGEILNLKQPVDYKLGTEQRIKNRILLYNKLKQSFMTLLKKDGTQDLINTFRQEFNWKSSEIGNVKILDFILWAGNRVKSK